MEFKRDIVKIRKELREDRNRNADSLRKELENIRRNKGKFAEMQTELKALNSRINNSAQ